MPNDFITDDPNSGHRFVIAIGSEMVAAFTECTLPTLEFEVVEQKEGGLNSYVHILPGPRKSGRVTLKRGIAKNSILLKWYEDLLKGENIKDTYRKLSIIMFNSVSEVVAWWYFDKAMPVKWTGPQLKSDQAALAIETLELVVHKYERVR